MAEIPSSKLAPPEAASRFAIRDGILLGLVLVTIVRSGEALAGEQTVIFNPALDPTASKLRQPAPPAALVISDPQSLFAPPALEEPAEFSTTDFSPRKHTLFDADPGANAYGDSAMLHGTTVWQRLQQYKSHDRVRLLTLWESSGSSVSLQAGRRGDPSLQWTSRWMNHGGSTQGLLDRWFSVSLAHAGSSLRSVAHMNSSPAVKPASVPAASELK